MHLFGFISFAILVSSSYITSLRVNDMLKSVLIFLLGVKIVSTVLPPYLQNVILKYLALISRAMADSTITPKWEFL
jgi:hypothetical protein